MVALVGQGQDSSPFACARAHLSPRGDLFKFSHKPFSFRGAKCECVCEFE